MFTNTSLPGSWAVIKINEVMMAGLVAVLLASVVIFQHTIAATGIAETATAVVKVVAVAAVRHLVVVAVAAVVEVAAIKMIPGGRSPCQFISCQHLS